MSRRDLLNACQRFGISTDHVARGKRGSKDNNWLRVNIVERCYGPGLAWHWKSAVAADATCVRATACCFGELGIPLEMSQRGLRNAMTEMVELRKLRALTRRKLDVEARLERSIRLWLDLCNAAQKLYEVEANMRDSGYDLGSVELATRAHAQQQYIQYIETTAEKRTALFRKP